jgi:hypothetical protein
MAGLFEHRVRYMSVDGKAPGQAAGERPDAPLRLIASGLVLSWLAVSRSPGRWPADLAVYVISSMP